MAGLKRHINYMKPPKYHNKTAYYNGYTYDSKLEASYAMTLDWYIKAGHVEYHEVKGFSTDLWRVKWRLVQAVHPDWKFQLIKK